MNYRKKWSDETVVSWAELFISKRTTLMGMEAMTGVSHSTVWWCFVHRLSSIDMELFDKVMDRIDINTHSKKMKKEESISRQDYDNARNRTCCICGENFEGWGNNPEPVKSDGVCCDNCNITRVIPARTAQLARRGRYGHILN